MKIHEKLKEIRKGLGLSLQDIHDIQASTLGVKEAISYRTLIRIEQGHIAKFSSIVKICQTLGITLPELFKDTDLEQTMVIKKDERHNRYEYNDKASASVVSSPSSNMLSLELILEPKGKTLKECSPANMGKFEKIIYVISGQLTCVVGDEKYILNPRDCMTLNSSIAHHYENNTNKNCACLITQTPKYI